MMKLAMSRACSSLLRQLIARSRLAGERILLTHLRTTEWRSLTFDGERHEICLSLRGVDAAEGADRLCAGIEDAEFNLSGAIVAEIAVRRRQDAPSGDVDLELEALTIAD